MIQTIRTSYNQNFTEEKYQNFLEDIVAQHQYKPPFHIAETPIFIDKTLKEKLVLACNDIIQVFYNSKFKEQTQGAFFDKRTFVPNEDAKPKFIQLDFGICYDEHQNLVPKLIELQGFPSLYLFQRMLGKTYRKYFGDVIPENYSQYINGLTDETYLQLLRDEIVGDTNPKQVVLLEIEPDKQATAIDFYATHKALGIQILCISQLKKHGRELYYINENGKKIRILKIYNRVIFDELFQRPDLKREFNFQEEVDVEWIGHPNWFYRISKYTMPLLKGEFVPKSYYLDKLENIPADLENYVLKPLYSFAGAGVQIHVTQQMIDDIADKQNYLLQEKVTYAPVIETLDEPAKCEVRMMLLHNSKTNKLEIVSNLVRLSKGEMVGVKYNKNKTWVGGSTAFFEG